MNRIDVSDSVELRDQYDDWFLWVPFLGQFPLLRSQHIETTATERCGILSPSRKQGNVPTREKKYVLGKISSFDSLENIPKGRN